MPLNVNPKFTSAEDIPEEEDEKKASLLFPFINSVTHKKNNLMQDPKLDPAFVEKEYKSAAYIVNRTLSQFPDTILFAQEINKRSLLDPKLQYLFYLGAIPSKFRKSDKWLRAEKIENLDLVKRYYKYSSKKARKALEILSEDDIKYIKDRLFEGGKLSKKKEK